MADKPSTLYLVVLAGIGSALLSPLTVQGMPIAILVIPFALLASYLYSAQDGMVVGIASSVLAGVLIADAGNWDIVIYALAAGLTVFALDTFYPKQKNTPYFLLFAGVGALLVEVLHDVYTGDSLLLRSEHFLGTNPAAGIRMVFNVLATAVLLSFYDAGTASAKK